MNADAWNLLAERSRALVHHTSLLMGTLTHPSVVLDDGLRLAHAARAAVAVEGLIAALAAAPELAAHMRTVHRFDSALAAWQRSVGETNPLERRYQAALLQQAAQVLTSSLHVETLAIGERARVEAAAFDTPTRTGHDVS